ncbi:Nucleoporin nup49/NSP49 (Nuclear pore protein nup49/NSP49) [Orbilia oligospora]|uniref:Nucleoporin nup49/NSP49 (Nuclear pore protein nup49/NSP49) n=1 Tax=Orbilia oligospora TaxID=2813651 RepID=A0A6G1MMQ0_ORBOL|nr:Nucleoporin nup49/NSP49 (Nuclear pore protein nup49/NSP49) [Orbilia oligospora]KAF3225882.1 Nucleoporin nup49/NSP49 (Nuclear pore protein nup49/NSP49) [Orbilia oligospora]KAF3226152.1 Nucleoporin nup49/NSP49 (Nuclear pore protein nup49/NSP49) [Orbilia oligospora]KAF3262347.1 Nucleoporin nup49/NSP49 (Nuclear pore protein nup49/NSP49) [Orbilia oligospora]
MSSLFNRVSSTPSAINTTAANTFGQGSGAATGGLGASVAGASIFGQSTSQQPPASAGLFGQNTTTAPSGGLFGTTAPTTTTVPSVGGLFSSATTTTSAPAAGGLFGGTTTAPAPAAGGLFGSTPATTSAGGGLLSVPTATTAAPASSGLFGSTATPQPAAGGGLFGAGSATQPAASGGLFGNSTAGGIGGGGASAGGLFGQQAPKPTPTLLSQPAAQPSTGLFGASAAQQPQASLFGQTQTQTQVQPQAVEMNFSNMRGTTRYEELHADVRSLLDFLDDYVQKAIGISQELGARSVTHKDAMESVEDDVEHVARKLGFATTFLNNDGHSIGQLHNASTQLINTATLSTRTIDILRLPMSQRSHYLSTHHTSNPEYSLMPYFEEKSGELESKATHFLATVGEVEKTLEAVERDVGQVNMSAESKVREVVKAERVVFSGMLAVASKVATVNEDLKTLTR